MKRNILLSIVIVIGVAILVRLAIVGKNQQKLLKEYQLAKATFQMTDADMVDFAKHRQEYFDGIKREDEYAAAIALRALVKLEQGDIAKAQSALEKVIATYYGKHRHDGNSNLLSNITTFAATNTALSNTIYGKLE